MSKFCFPNVAFWGLCSSPTAYIWVHQEITQCGLRANFPIFSQNTPSCGSIHLSGVTRSKHSSGSTLVFIPTTLSQEILPALRHSDITLCGSRGLSQIISSEKNPMGHKDRQGDGEASRKLTRVTSRPALGWNGHPKHGKGEETDGVADQVSMDTGEIHHPQDHLGLTAFDTVAHLPWTMTLWV